LTANWYIIRVQVGREERIRENLVRRVKQEGLEDQVLDVLLPVETVTDVKGGKKRTTKKKLFPGYLMVHMELSDEVWFLLRETNGFGDFVGGGRNPVPMSPDEIESILQTMESTKEKPKLSVAFKKGDRVKIKSGHFENFDGVVDEVNAEKGSVRVVVTIFGRATPVDLEYWELEQV
jgi:transcriptional antiterminator NusG